MSKALDVLLVLKELLMGFVFKTNPKTKAKVKTTKKNKKAATSPNFFL